jgi:prepilin-type N-terminal cleavage/methylation domain-containing protein
MTQRGFTLIEIMIALVLLAVVILGLATTTSQFVHTVVEGQGRTAGIELAQQRIAQIQLAPNYAALDTAFGKTETTFPGLTGYKRITTVRHVGSSTDTISGDYKLFTVKVMAPGIADTIQRTVLVAAP